MRWLTQTLTLTGGEAHYARGSKSDSRWSWKLGKRKSLRHFFTFPSQWKNYEGEYKCFQDIRHQCLYLLFLFCSTGLWIKQFCGGYNYMQSQNISSQPPLRDQRLVPGWLTATPTTPCDCWSHYEHARFFFWALIFITLSKIIKINPHGSIKRSYKWV